MEGAEMRKIIFLLNSLKKVTAYGLMFALFLLPIFMPLAKAGNTVVHKTNTLQRKHGHKTKNIKHRTKSRKSQFLEGPTAEERQAAKEQEHERRQEKRTLLQKQHEEKLKEWENTQEQKRQLREYRDQQRKNTTEKAGQELHLKLKEESAQQGQETVSPGTPQGQHH